MSRGRHANRDLRLLLVGRAGSNLGDLISSVAVPFAVLGTMRGTVTDVGLVLAANFTGMLAFVIVGGALADRLSARRTMVASDVVSCAVQATVAVLLVSGAMTVALFAALMLTQGLVSACFRPAARALLPQIVERAALLDANARLATVTSVMTAVGPAIGGALVAVLGPSGGVAVNAGSFLLSALLVGRIRYTRPPSVRAATGSGRLVVDLREGWREVARRQWLWVSILFAALVELFGSASLTTLAPLTAQANYGGVHAYSWMLSAMGVGAIAGGLVVGKLPIRRHVMVVNLMIAPIAAVPTALAVGAPLVAVLVAFGVAGLCESICGALWHTALGRAVPRQMLGRVNSWDTLGSFAMRPAGHALVGFIAGAVGTGPVLWLAAAAFALFTLPVVAVAEVRMPLTELEAVVVTPNKLVRNGGAT